MDTRPTTCDLDDIDALFDEVMSPEARAAERDATELFNLLHALRKVREDVKISQREVAQAMGTSQSAVSNLEGGAVDPQIATLMRYARALGVRVRLRATIDGDLAPELNARRWVEAANRRHRHTRVMPASPAQRRHWPDISLRPTRATGRVGA